MDWIYMALFKTPKAFHIGPILHSHWQWEVPCVATAALRQNYRSLAANRLPPTPNIHSDLDDAVSVQCLAQGHNDELG